MIKFKTNLLKPIWLLLIALLLVAGLGMWMLREATPYGLGLRNDSVQYIFGARNLLAGNGYMRTSGGGELKPISTVPPALSTAIAGLSLTGLEPMRSARFLIILFLGLDTILLGYLIHRLTASVGFALAGAALFGFSSVILENFAWLMSEPLFICMWLLCFILWDVYSKTRRIFWLVVLGLACGVAYLTRYIGITLVATFGLMLILLEPGWKARLLSLASLLLSFLPFMGAWALRNSLLIGNPVNRTLINHPVTAEKIHLGINNFWDWLLPNNLTDIPTHTQSILYIAFYILFGLFLFGIVYFLVRALRRTSNSSHFETGLNPGLLAVATYGLVYPATTLFSMSFVDASTILDHRLMIPFYLVILILLMAGMTWLFSRKMIAYKMSALLVVLMAVGWTAYDGWHEVMVLGQNGLGFTSTGITESPTIRYIKQMPPGVIYSNRAYMVYITTDRLAYMLTGPTDPVTASKRENADEEMTTMREAVMSGAAYLVYFKDVGYATDPYYLMLINGLHPIEEYSDGIIFKGSD